MKFVRLLILCFFLCLFGCLLVNAAFSQESPKYQVATIMAVKKHQVFGEASNAAQYDISVKIAGDMYVVFYTDPTFSNAVQYVAGRQLLVSVGKTTITYNDILGRSLEVPIVSREKIQVVSTAK